MDIPNLVGQRETRQVIHTSWPRRLDQIRNCSRACWPFPSFSSVSFTEQRFVGTCLDWAKKLVIGSNEVAVLTGQCKFLILGRFLQLFLGWTRFCFRSLGRNCTTGAWTKDRFVSINKNLLQISVQVLVLSAQLLKRFYCWPNSRCQEQTLSQYTFLAIASVVPELMPIAAVKNRHKNTHLPVVPERETNLQLEILGITAFYINCVYFLSSFVFTSCVFSP